MKELAEFRVSGIVSNNTMRAIDNNADACGVASSLRMEAAGVQLANAIQMEHPKKIIFFSGSGNNGGDGYVAARHLADVADVVVVSLGAKTPDARAALAALKDTSASVLTVESEFDLIEGSPIYEATQNADIIVDCLLGTGARKPLRGNYATLASLMNTVREKSSTVKIIACDIPTPDVRADRTCAFHLAKSVGAEVYPIGIPLAAEVFVGKGDLLNVSEKSSSSHKGAGGSVLVIGGGPYQGAPFLAGVAALRAGADIVRVASPVDGFMPDIILERLEGNKISAEHKEKLMALAKAADVVIAGPGLGVDEESLEVLRDVVAHAKNAVVDADLLRHPLPRAKGSTIYTPHAGEFRRLFDMSVPENLHARGVMVREAAKSTGGIVVLKGEVDVISDGTRVRFNRTGTASMTTGGTGDVLAGVVGGLLAGQTSVSDTMSAFDAACVAVYAEGLAGEMVAEDVGDGLMASDLLKEIAGILFKRDGSST